MQKNDFFDISAGSIFYWNDNRKLLKLGGSTGLTTDERSTDVMYRSDRVDSPTVQVATRANIVVSIDYKTDIEPSEDYVENLSNPETFIAIPIMNWGNKIAFKNRKPLGVYRAINAKFQYGGRKVVLPFTWEEISYSKFYTDVLGVGFDHYRKSHSRADDYERVLHGLRASIETVIQSISHFTIRPKSITINESYNYPKSQQDAHPRQARRRGRSRRSV